MQENPTSHAYLRDFPNFFSDREKFANIFNPKFKFVMKKPTPYFWLEELVVPTFEIAANPTIKFNETKQRRFYIIQR
jgi:hypothetical protein